MQPDGKFGTRLRDLRKNSGKSQKELAQEIGIAKRTIEDYEQSKAKDPNAFTLLLLAAYFDVDPTFLLFGGNSKMATNAYVQMVKEEMKQLCDSQQVREIHDSNYNGTVTKLAVLDQDLADIANDWKERKLFASRVNKPYIHETMVKYCQNRGTYLSKFNIKNGLEILKEKNGIA